LVFVVREILLQTLYTSLFTINGSMHIMIEKRNLTKVNYEKTIYDLYTEAINHILLIKKLL